MASSRVWQLPMMPWPRMNPEIIIDALKFALETVWMVFFHFSPESSTTFILIYTSDLSTVFHFRAWEVGGASGSCGFMALALHGGVLADIWWCSDILSSLIMVFYLTHVIISIPEWCLFLMHCHLKGQRLQAFRAGFQPCTSRADISPDSQPLYDIMGCEWWQLHIEEQLLSYFFDPLWSCSL